MNTLVQGIDISHFQGNEVQQITRSQTDLNFIICKATQGLTITDKLFQNNWQLIKEKGYFRGAYHFYISKDEPIAQANHFLSVISSLENTDLPPILDIEEQGIEKSFPSNKIQSDIKIFLAEIQQKSRRTPIIYTDLNVGNTYLNTPEFAEYPLWIASYNGKPSPNVPNGWRNKGWTLWQKTDNYKLDGFTNDYDVFNGSLDDFKEFIENSFN